MNNRVERMFGPRESWGNGDERERVEAGKRRAAAAGKRVTERPGGGKRKDTPSTAARAHSPMGEARGSVPAGELKKAGFAKGGEPEGVKGFLSIRCGGCGRIVNTCLHERRTIFNCKACGHPNPLEGLKTMKVECTRCSFRGRYQTNRVDSPIAMECLNCSQLVQLRRGNRRGNYVTVREDRQ